MSIGCQLPFLCNPFTSEEIPHKKLGEVAHSKSGVNLEIPQKSWEESLSVEIGLEIESPTQNFG